MQITSFLFYIIQLGIFTIIYLAVYAIGFLAASKGAKQGIPGLGHIRIGFLILIIAVIFARLSNAIITYYVLSNSGDILRQYALLFSIVSLSNFALSILGFIFIIYGIRTLVSQYKAFEEI